MEFDPCGNFSGLNNGSDKQNMICHGQEKLHLDLIDLDLCSHQTKPIQPDENEPKKADGGKVMKISTSDVKATQEKEKDANVALSAICCAIEEADLECLSKILAMSNIEHLNQTNKHGEGAVHVAAGLGQLEILKALAVKGVDLCLADYRGDTPIFWAARQGHEEIIQYLLAQGVQSNQQNKDGDTPLHLASSQGYLNCVKCLLEARAEVDVPNDGAVGGNTPLHLSIIRHYTSVAMALLHSGADFDLANAHGDTPIHLAAREGLLGLSQSLCAFGCVVDVTNKDGLYPLHLAAKNGHKELVRCLALAGCRTDIKTKEGLTPELMALAQGHADINELLKRLKRDGCDDYIEQLIPMPMPIPKIKMKVFGHSGVGKTTLIESMRAGIFSGLFRRSRRRNPVRKAFSQDDVPQIVNSGQRKCVATKAIVHESFTRGVDITQCNLGNAGDLSIWEFSGQENYFIVYDHFIGNTNCIHTIVYNLEEHPDTQYKQIRFWLDFLQSKIPPVEPLGPNGKSHKPARVLLVGTHPDTANCRKNVVGEYTSQDTDQILGRILNEFGNVFNIHAHAFLIDANVANSASMKAFKTALSDFKTEIVDGREAKSLNVLAENEFIGLDCFTGDLSYSLVTQREPDHQGLPRLTRFLENIVSYLPDWRKSMANFQAVPWHYFVDHVRMNINPLAADDHMKEIIQQLQLMGEVVYIKGEKCADMIVLDPRWICVNICGHFLSPQFTSQTKSSGCYTLNELRGVSNEHEVEDLIPIFESLSLCATHDNESETVYEFPIYTRENFEGILWNKEETRFQGGIFGGVLLRASSSSSSNKLLAVMFPRLQTQMRRSMGKKQTPGCQLIQLSNVSKYCLSNIESLVILDTDNDTIQVKVRGMSGQAKECFLFLEDILGILDHVLLEMSPGMGVDKCMMSSYDLKNYKGKVHTWNPVDIVKTLFRNGFESFVHNSSSNVDELMTDLLCFGSKEISSALCIGKDLHISTVATLTRQQLCQLLDPPDPLGKDWCMLVVKLEMSDKLPKLAETKKASSYSSCANVSPTAKLLDEWERKNSSTVGELMLKLEELGRDDTVNVLLAGCSLYRIIAMDESDGPTTTTEKVGLNN